MSLSSRPVASRGAPPVPRAAAGGPARLSSSHLDTLIWRPLRRAKSLSEQTSRRRQGRALLHALITMAALKGDTTTLAFHGVQQPIQERVRDEREERDHDQVYGGMTENGGADSRVVGSVTVSSHLSVCSLTVIGRLTLSHDPHKPFAASSTSLPTLRLLRSPGLISPLVGWMGTFPGFMPTRTPGPPNLFSSLTLRRTCVSPCPAVPPVMTPVPPKRFFFITILSLEES